MTYCQHCGAKIEWQHTGIRRYYKCGTFDYVATGHTRSELCRLREEIQKGNFYKAVDRANKWTKKPVVKQSLTARQGGGK